MKVKALQPIYYAGQQYAPGDEYEMDDRDGQEARVLVDLGKIEMCAADQPKPEPTAAPPEPPQQPPKSPAQPMTTENTSTLTPPKEGEK